MTKDEALKLALEALQNPWKAGPDGVADAIIAIKEVLAQPEQEQFALKHRIAELEGAVIGLQAQRTWVGLTDEEIEQGCKESWITEQAFQSAVWWAESKLKEKNT